MADDQLKQQVRDTLVGLGYDPDAKIVTSSDSANQCIMRRGHPLAGASIRNLLVLWKELTGTEYEITYDEDENWN